MLISLFLAYFDKMFVLYRVSYIRKWKYGDTPISFKIRVTVPAISIMYIN